MGEEMNNFRIFTQDGQEIATGISDTQLHISADPKEEETDWNQHGYEITGTLTTTPEESEQFRKIIESMKFSRKELRKMYHAVTHGGAIVFQSYFNAEYDNGETEEFVRNIYINRPRILRKMIAANRRFRFNYDIVQHFDPKDKIILSELER